MNSIEWLIDQLGWNNRSNAIDRIVEQAKEMRRKEIIEAWEMGRFNIDAIGSGEEYYNETYKK